MTHKAALAAAVLMAVGGPALAQGVTGGQLSIEYNAPTDGSDFGGTTYSGGLEYAITRQISVGVDATGFNPTNLSIEGTNVTLHGTYHLSDTASAGLFYGRDSLEGADDTATVYGIEGGTELMGGEVAGYLGKSDEDDGGATLFGVSGSYDLTPEIALIGGFDLLSLDSDVSVSRTTIGAEYRMLNGPQLYAHIGQVGAEVGTLAGDQTFIGVGARVAFGAARGTTFDGRSTLSAVAGF